MVENYISRRRIPWSLTSTRVALLMFWELSWRDLSCTPYGPFEEYLVSKNVLKACLSTNPVTLPLELSKLLLEVSHSVSVGFLGHVIGTRAVNLPVRSTLSNGNILTRFLCQHAVM